MRFRLDHSSSTLSFIAIGLLTFLVLFFNLSFLPITGLRPVHAESVTAVGSEGLNASAHINFTIIMPERIDVKIPAAIQTDSPGSGDQQAVSNSGPLSVTVDQTSFTYVGTTKVDVYRLSMNETGPGGTEPTSVPENGSPPLITIASP